MSCDQCREREAVIHLTQIVNDQVTTLHLCEKCAAEKGVESPGAHAKTPLGTFLIAAMGKGTEQLPTPPLERRLLPVRGARSRISARPAGWAARTATARSRRRSATCSAGCTARPTTWASAMPSARPPPAAAADEQAAELREQLRLAVETENFELAAELRDRLRVLE